MEAEHNLSKPLGSTGLIRGLPARNQSVCIRNTAVPRSLDFETCHVGRVIRTFTIGDKWYCTVNLYLRPVQISALIADHSYVVDTGREIIKSCVLNVGSFELKEIFAECKILPGDLTRSPESIIQQYRGNKPCFVIRYQVQMKEGTSGLYTIAPIIHRKKMVLDKSEVLSENGLNMKSQEGAASALIAIKSPGRPTRNKAHTENNLVSHHHESKENIQNRSENYISSREMCSPSPNHEKPSRASVRRSLATDLDFSPVKQSRTDDSVVIIENVSMEEDSDSTCKDSWVSELLDTDDPIVENDGRCLTPIRLSLKRIRLDTTPSKEHSKSNRNILSAKKKLSRSAQKKEKLVSSHQNETESDSDIDYRQKSSSILPTVESTRRSTRQSKCKFSLAEAATDSESEEVFNKNLHIVQKLENRKETDVSSPKKHQTPKRKAALSDDSSVDGNRSTRYSINKREVASTSTTPTSKRTNKFEAPSPSKDPHSSEALEELKSPVDSSFPLSQRKSGRTPQPKGKCNEDGDSILSPDVIPLAYRTPNKTKAVNDKTPKRTPKTSSKTPSKTSSKTPSKSPRTPKQKTTAKTPTRSALTPSMPARASAPVTPMTNLEQVRKNLHVSAVPMSLPCRESEYRNIYNFLENKLRDSAGGCMYISGVPGTGKTATVNAVVRSLKEQVQMKKLKDFQYIETNGLRMTEPRQVFVQVLKGLTGQKCTPQQAQDILAERFCSGSAKNKTVVLLVDEVDMLRNRRQDVIYNLFDWPSKPNSRFIVLTIANTMDLPERLLKGRVTSRLGLTRLTFQPYSYKQLQEIVMSRLQGSNSFNVDAVELVARKVAACSGDVRRALDICRRASEVVQEGSPVTMPIINQVLSQMMNSANVCSIKACSKLEKLFLQAVVAENERTGVEETTFISVYRQFQSLCALSNVPLVNISEAMAVLSRLGTSGLLLIEHSRADIHQSIFLNVNADDIHYALNPATSKS